MFAAPLRVIIDDNRSGRYSHLARRGLWQTAFSYAKALLSLDPEVSLLV